MCYDMIICWLKQATFPVRVQLRWITSNVAPMQRRRQTCMHCMTCAMPSTEGPHQQLLSHTTAYIQGLDRPASALRLGEEAVQLAAVLPAQALLGPAQLSGCLGCSQQALLLCHVHSRQVQDIRLGTLQLPWR